MWKLVNERFISTSVKEITEISKVLQTVKVTTIVYDGNRGLTAPPISAAVALIRISAGDLASLETTISL